MFKLESYITPILLSYVDKYIKNFRPEDSQLSLWGGDASFHNLDLRLEVLEQELQLPFSFVSGHVYELLIHVPWTKITSEPITITINTIECILKLKTSSNTGSAETVQSREKQRRASNRKNEIEAPPGYVQSLINKIVNNIRIYCNNLILKYVEDDIVLSMNVKLLTFESANEKWESAYTDISQNGITLRKLIQVSDLTICLDKRNAAGKIDMYQEPILYRCSFTLYMLRHYHSATSKRPTTTRFDVFCDSLEFSATETQIPMLIRISKLINALASKELKPESQNSSEVTTLSSENSVSEKPEHQESWASWAWSFIPTLTSPEDESDETQTAYAGHTMQFGVYIDRISVTFKVSESNTERSYYSQKRVKYWPLLLISLQGVFLDNVMHEIKWSLMNFGISEIAIYPIGQCSCSHTEVKEGVIPKDYFKAGQQKRTYKEESLFDPEAVENKGQEKESSNLDWDYHLRTVTEAVLLERTPAFAVDSMHQIEIPDDTSSEVLLDLANNREYSNFNEKSLVRVVVGPFSLRICSGLFHRVGSIWEAASVYDYLPYSIPKPEPSLSELPPPKAEDYDALNENIPLKSTQITFVAPTIQLFILDHPYFIPMQGDLFRRKKPTIPHPNKHLPRLFLQCECIDIKITSPMYEKRLIETTCQLPNPPAHMFKACHQEVSGKMFGFQSKLVFDSKTQTIIIPPASASCSINNILKPQYWVNPNILHQEFLFESETCSVTGTKAKVMITLFILDLLSKWKNDNQQTLKTFLNSSLLKDCTTEVGEIFIELTLENIRLKCIATSTTVAADASLDCIKGFVFKQFVPNVRHDIREREYSELYSASSKRVRFLINNIHQVMFISGPEIEGTSESGSTAKPPCVTLTLQFPISPEKQVHAPIFTFNVQQICICCDPLLSKWLCYCPVKVKQEMETISEFNFPKAKAAPETSTSILETPRKLNTPQESVHSSSDRDHIHSLLSQSVACKEDKTPSEQQEGLFDIIKRWSNIWTEMLACGQIEQCTILVPMSSLSAIDSQSITEAVNKRLKRKGRADILVLVLPTITLESSTNCARLSTYSNELPIEVPSTIWTPGKTSFPWNISVEKLNCYSLQMGRKLDILSDASLKATISFGTKSSESNLHNMPPTAMKTAQSDLAADIRKTKGKLDSLVFVTTDQSNKKDVLKSININVHIDTKPILIKLSEIQICLLATILYGFLERLNFWLDQTEEENPPETVPYFSDGSIGTPLVCESSLEGESEGASSSYESPLASKTEKTVEWSAWIQWTMAQFTLELLAYDFLDLLVDNNTYQRKPNLKLILDAEDIVSSLNIQEVYLKFKTKIGSFCINHMQRAQNTVKWSNGPYLGIVMIERDDVNQEKGNDSSDIISITITRANSKHTHALWGTLPKTKKSKSENMAELIEGNRFITEIDVTVKPLELVLPFSVLRNFYLVLEPLLMTTSQKEIPESADSLPFSKMNNQNLPLAYFRCQGIRIVIPSTNLKNEHIHDVCMLQIGNIELTPSATNPICRSPCRPDIYQQGARAHVLNIPGSALEDRQYQLDIIGICVNSFSSDDLLDILDMEIDVPKSRSISENPALKWNNLEAGILNADTQNIFSPIVKRFDMTFVFAPAMIYKSDTVVSGHSVEVNFVSDIEAIMSIQQIKLIYSLVNESVFMWQPFSLTDLSTKRPKVNISCEDEDTVISDDDNELEEEGTTESLDHVRDSGIETSEKRSAASVLTAGVTSESSDYCDQDKKTKGYDIDKIPSTFARPSCSFGKQNIPVDILITGGKIVFCLYFIDKPFPEKSSQEIKVKIPLLSSHKVHKDLGSTVDTKGTEAKDFHPLFFIQVYQPNAFASLQQMCKRVQASCLDVKIKTNTPVYKALVNIPSEEDYPIPLVETRTGKPNPDTGIPPAFFTLKWSKSLGKSSSLEVEFGKPTRLEFSLKSWQFMLLIKDKLTEIVGFAFEGSHFQDTDVILKKSKQVDVSHKPADTFTKLMDIKKKLYGVASINLKVAQVVLVIKTDSNCNAVFSVGSFRNYLTILSRPERVNNVISVENVSLSFIKDKQSRILLNPWTVSTEVSFFWEPWQSLHSTPQMQMSVDSDNIILDLSLEHIRSFKLLLDEINEVFEIAEADSKGPSEIHLTVSEVEQHYKDDLRAGAFQFVSATTNSADELPLPYQVMFWENNIAAMAWRYPQPRALTKVRVFPVPFKVSSDSYKEQVMCCLEYWSECHCSYQPYTQFYLSESEMCYVDLPKHRSYPTVACIWRVVLYPINYKSGFDNFDPNKFLISPRALAACLRIDSYFNKNLVPDFSIAVNISSITISLYSNFDKDQTLEMPDFLKLYSFDRSLPKDQCFLIMNFDIAKLHIINWMFEDYLIDLSTSIKCSVLEYTFLTLQSFLEPFLLKLEVDLSDHKRIDILSQPINIKYGPPIGHTLTVSMQMWNENWKSDSKKELIILTQFVICNDSNITIKFGQKGTDEEILLPSRFCNLYCWRSQKASQLLRMGLEMNDWKWSKGFDINTEGTKAINIDRQGNVCFFVTVKKISTTQRQIILSANLVMCNMLSEHFEFKVVKDCDEDKAKFKKSVSHILEGNSTPPSILLFSKQKYCLRLRFLGIKSAWSGNIPLKINKKTLQPWLVKVPLQEQGQYLSIWCKIITQKFPEGKKILVILWPLYMIRSNLAIEGKCKIETASIDSTVDTIVKGQGKLQQLYCPGAFEDKHTLNFYFDNDIPAFNSVVPLSFSLVDQVKFFKRHTNENITEVLEVIHNLDKDKWPYFNDDLSDFQWIIEDQPATVVQVRYKEVCPYSGSLLIELLPWCLLVNNLGCDIAIIVNGGKPHNIHHHGIVSPPKIEENFHISVSINKKVGRSPPLHLANSDWSQAFYMPKISGTIPLNGYAQVPIRSGSFICMLSICSSIYNEMRLLKVSSSHVLINYLPIQLHVVCFAVPDNGAVFNLPKNMEKLSFTVDPYVNKEEVGLSLTKWFALEKILEDNFALYIVFSINPKFGWSCPVQVDKSSLRRCISVKSAEESIPLVVTSQGDKGQVYIAVHFDTHPQMLIENRSGRKLYFAQPSKNENEVIINDAKHFKCVLGVENGFIAYYSLPTYSDKFPEIADDSEEKQLVIAAEPEGDPLVAQWSNPIDISICDEHFVRIPAFRDVKLMLVESAHTIFVIVDSVSQAEICAKDIRMRLAMYEKQCLAEVEKRPLRPLESSAALRSKSSRRLLRRTSERFADLPTIRKLEESKEELACNLPKSLTTYWETESATTLGAHKTLDKSFTVQVFLKEVIFTFTSDLEDKALEIKEIVNFIFDEIAFTYYKKEMTHIELNISEIQIDNQMYARGGFDFPVVLVSQTPRQLKKHISPCTSIEQLIKETRENALIRADMCLENWKDRVLMENRTDMRSIYIAIQPLSAYIEDVFVMTLKDYMLACIPSRLVFWSEQKDKVILEQKPEFVHLPNHVVLASKAIAYPITTRKVAIEQWTLLLSVHSSIKVFIALDQSPLTFGRFEHRNLMTTPYRLGYALTLHYLSAAIFGAGWVVGSLELLGSPGTLAREMGQGLKDFLSLPYLGLIEGPWAFLMGITNGSASLMKHITAGTLQSVTKLASSVARNLDRLTLDEEHLKRTEEQRRQRPQGVAQGFIQGLSGLGISMLGALGGLAHHPLQIILKDGATPKGLATGVGRGIVGVFTKPISGAADLVALTGQGLLQGAGWNTFPEPRVRPVLLHIYSNPNSSLKYTWKIGCDYPQNNIFFITDATGVTDTGSYAAVSLILTADALVIVNVDEDIIERVINLKEVEVIENASDPTLLIFKLLPPKKPVKISEDDVPEMDPTSRARVINYVKNTSGLMQLQGDSRGTSEMSVSPIDSPNRLPSDAKDDFKLLSYYVNPNCRNWFVRLLNLIKEQQEDYNFQIF